MTELFLVNAMGRSGGSWMEAVFNFHLGVRVWEEPRRKLNLPSKGLEENLLQFFKEQHAGSQWQAVGLIKGFRDKVIEYCLEQGGHVVSQYRNPIKVVHGKRRRRKKAEIWWGRTDLTEDEIFEGILCKTAYRYGVWHSNISRWPLIRLEDLDVSLYTDGLYFKQVMEYITQVEWSRSLVAEIQDGAVPPADRRGLPADKMWLEDAEWGRHVEWERHRDPSARTIWRHWEGWQQEIFLREFSEIMITGGYKIPA